MIKENVLQPIRVVVSQKSGLEIKRVDLFIDSNFEIFSFNTETKTWFVLLSKE